MALRLGRRPALVLLASMVTACGAQPSRVVADESSARLTFASGHLVFEVPLEGEQGEARVSAELLDPMNQVRSEGVATCSVSRSGSVCRVELPPIAVDDQHAMEVANNLPLFRVRYTVVAGTSSISEILALDHIAPSLFVLHMAAPDRIRPAASYIARVRATHPLTHLPQANLPLEATLSASFTEDEKPDADVARLSAVTDAGGFASFSFTAPDVPDLSSVDLEVQGTIGNLHPGVLQTLNVVDETRLNLTTDKPLYQPGQTVHARLLLLDRTGKAVPGTRIQVDFEDPDSTLVFRAEAVTSDFGIATVDWPVPSRLRLGDYEVTASVKDDARFDRSANARLRLSHYDLPTFVVEPKPDLPFYLPGSNAVVTVRGAYLFGKPVLRGHVRVVREEERTWDFTAQKWTVKESKPVSGELDNSGSFRANISLAADLAKYGDREGWMQSTEFDDLHFAAYLTDASTGRTEQRRFDIRLTPQALHLYVTEPPHARGLPQRVYLSATTADGRPAQSDVDVSLLPREGEDDSLIRRVRRAPLLLHLKTDKNGLARLDLPTYDALKKLMPPASGSPARDLQEDNPTIFLRAHDQSGHTGSVTHPVHSPEDQLQLRVSKAILRPGDPLEIEIESAKPSLPVTLQILRSTTRGALTLATQNLSLHDGHASLTLPTDERYRGVVWVAAASVATRDPKWACGGSFGFYLYRNNQDDCETEVVSRAVLFPQDTSLHVDLRMSSATYKPGEQATASIVVKGPQDPDGDDTTPVPSAVGIVAVDQAVEERNRTDNDFGGQSASFFFRGDSSLDGGSAGGFTFHSLNQLEPGRPVPEEAQLAGEILLTGWHAPFGTTENVPAQNLAEVYRVLIDGQLIPARTALARYLDTHTELPTSTPELTALLASLQVDFTALRDPWDEPYTLVATPDPQGTYVLTLRSSGPDKRADTADDFTVPLASWHWFNGHQRALQRALGEFHGRTGRFIRTVAELRDEMKAEGIAFEDWRDPWGQPFSFRFSIQQTQFVVEALHRSDPVGMNRGLSTIGSARVDYTDEVRRIVTSALMQYAKTHPYPVSQDQFLAALRESGLSAAQLTDPWHRPLYATFRTRSFFTDRVRTEAHAIPGGVPQVRTTSTPVTAIEDIVDLHSEGPDRRRSTSDDFLYATFRRTRATQSAQDSTPQTLAHSTIATGASGVLAGAITDASGATVSGAMVVAKSSDTGATYAEKTDASGRFVIASLPVGLYTVTITATGFMSFVYDQVEVLVHTTVMLDASLKPGTLNETVMVEAQALTTETESASVGQVLDGVANLPLANRQFYNLVQVAPGVAPPPPPTPTQQTSTPKLRNYFPETLLWRPEIITATDGTAALSFPVADNITAWTVSAAASTREGNVGSGSTSFSTFQPFFAAFDPPSLLTVGDTIALPITLRNYLGRPVTVDASIVPAPWFRLAGASKQTVPVASAQSASPVFRFTALTKVTEAEQEFRAESPDAGDRIAKPVTVHPQGQESAVTAAGILAPGDTTFTITLPPETVPGSSETTIRIYPNLGARLRDALDAMATYPNGCAEQIISTAWPSLLLERYAGGLPTRDEKVQKRTLRYLREAYENLLADQRSTGGFSYWTNDKNADAVLTAYAVQFLNQADAYITVDPEVGKRAVAYLARIQQNDGRWIRTDREGKAHPEDARANAMLTASIASLIAEAPGAEPLIKKALPGLQPFIEEFDEPYTLASYAMAALSVNDAARSDASVKRLRSLALSENGGAYWSLETNTPFFGWGRAGRVESTAQVLRALIAAGADPKDELVGRGLLWLTHEQDRHTLWYSTQATARVLDLLAAVALRVTEPRTSNADNVLRITADRDPAIEIPLPSIDKDTGPIYSALGDALSAGVHQVTLHLAPGASAATAQLVTAYYHPWPLTAPTAAVTNNEQLHMKLAYSTLSPLPGETVTVGAHIERVGFRGYGMMIAEVGLPPGADVDRASLEKASDASGYQLNHYEVMPDKVLIYLWPRAGGLDFKFRFTMRYAVDALVSASSVYDYYNPDARLDLTPERFTMRMH